MGENRTEPRKSAQLLMESTIFQCGSPSQRAADKSRETKRSISIGSTMAILQGRRVARARVFMELKIEKLFGEEFARESQLPGEERRARFTPRPIADYSLVFAALPGVLRRRESAISFLEIRQDFIIRVFAFFCLADTFTFSAEYLLVSNKYVYNM